jgi:hypothetical protein
LSSAWACRGDHVIRSDLVAQYLDCHPVLCR